MFPLFGPKRWLKLFTSLSPELNSSPLFFCFVYLPPPWCKNKPHISISTSHAIFNTSTRFFGWNVLTLNYIFVFRPSKKYPKYCSSSNLFTCEDLNSKFVMYSSTLPSCYKSSSSSKGLSLFILPHLSYVCFNFNQISSSFIFHKRLK